MSEESRAASAASTDALIERCLAGDQDAWQQIVRLYWRKVFNVAYRFVGRHDEAEDLTQEIFLKISRALHTFDRRANFQTWIISVSRNLCIDHYRSMRRERETIARDITSADVSPVAKGRDPLERLEIGDLRRRVRTALAALPEPLRVAVEMRDLKEYTYDEIARTLGLPDGTVKSRIHRGRLELARELRRLQAEAERPQAGGGTA